MGLGRGHVEISQTRFPQAHTLHRFNNTETTLTSTAPEAVQTTGSTSVPYGLDQLAGDVAQCLVAEHLHCAVVDTECVVS